MKRIRFNRTRDDSLGDIKVKARYWEARKEFGLGNGPPFHLTVPGLGAKARRSALIQTDRLEKLVEWICGWTGFFCRQLTIDAEIDDSSSLVYREDSQSDETKTWLGYVTISATPAINIQSPTWTQSLCQFVGINPQEIPGNVATWFKMNWNRLLDAGLVVPVLTRHDLFSLNHHSPWLIDTIGLVGDKPDKATVLLNRMMIAAWTGQWVDVPFLLTQDLFFEMTKRKMSPRNMNLTFVSDWQPYSLPKNQDLEWRIPSDKLWELCDNTYSIADVGDGLVPSIFELPGTADFHGTVHAKEWASPVEVTDGKIGPKLTRGDYEFLSVRDWNRLTGRLDIAGGPSASQSVKRDPPPPLDIF